MADRRSIFITGGASGIGTRIARHFGERGWFIGIADVNETGMEDTLGLYRGRVQIFAPARRARPGRLGRGSGRLPSLPPDRGSMRW